MDSCGVFRAEYAMPLADAPDHDYCSGYDKNMTAQAFNDAFLGDGKAFSGMGQPARGAGLMY